MFIEHKNRHFLKLKKLHFKHNYDLYCCCRTFTQFWNQLLRSKSMKYEVCLSDNKSSFFLQKVNCWKKSFIWLSFESDHAPDTAALQNGTKINLSPSSHKLLEFKKAKWFYSISSHFKMTAELTCLNISTLFKPILSVESTKLQATNLDTFPFF